MVQINTIPPQKVSFTGQKRKSNTAGKIAGGTAGWFAARHINNTLVPAQLSKLSPGLKEYFAANKATQGIKMLDIARGKLNAAQTATLEKSTKLLKQLSTKSKVAVFAVPTAVILAAIILGSKLGGKIQDKIQS